MNKPDIYQLRGVTGDEEGIRLYVQGELNEKEYACRRDKVGNVLTVGKGRLSKTLLCSQMDEPGFIITGIQEDGTLTFGVIGNIDKSDIPAKGVMIYSSKQPGVFGIRSIHLQTKIERVHQHPLEAMYIDIGAQNAKQAGALVQVGDYATWYTSPVDFGENLLIGRAVASRSCCKISIQLLKALKNSRPAGAFLVQEEVGARGSEALAMDIGNYPFDTAIFLGSIDCEGSYSSEKANEVEIEKGPILAYSSGQGEESLYHYGLIEKNAASLNIPLQKMVLPFGANMKERFDYHGPNLSTVMLCLPCRYKGTQSEVISLRDKMWLEELLSTLFA